MPSSKQNTRSNYLTSSDLPPQSPSTLASTSTPHLANADTGTTGHYIAVTDTALLLDIQPTTATNTIRVTLPDGAVISSTHTATLNLPSLPLAARRAHIFPALVCSLLSIGELCDSGLIAIYTSTTVTIFNGPQVVLTGTRSPETRLWMVDLTAASNQYNRTDASIPFTPTAASVILSAHSTQAQIVTWYHATMGSPAIPTFLSAVERGYIILPGLTATMIRKYPPSSVATSKGHLDQTRQGLRTTQQPPAPAEESDTDRHPAVSVSQSSPPPRGPSRVFTKILSVPDPTGRRASDLTGRFPVASKRGNQYILIMFCEDFNYIRPEPLRLRDQVDYVKAYASGDEFFRSHGVIPVFERLDNETSKQLERYCRSHNITIQYCPPGMHRANKAERCIRTFKNHFISTLATADVAFPLSSWDELLPQAELTLNLMRSSGRTAQISAWQQLHGHYDFNSHPIAPPGMRIVTHDKPSDRASWAPHGTEGFYVGPAFQHYRCFRVITKEQAERITDTLAWHPSAALRLPGSSVQDDLISSLAQLSSAITALSTSPNMLSAQRRALFTVLPSLTDAIQSLSSIFQSSSPSTAPADSEPPALDVPLGASHDGSLVPAVIAVQADEAAPHPPALPPAAEQRVPHVNPAATAPIITPNTLHDTATTQRGASQYSGSTASTI
eukprot:gene38071-46978_t